MDNLSAHKPARAREVIEPRGRELIYLPACSPDFNPIEEAFAKIEGTLCAKQEPARRTLWWTYRAKRFRRSAPRTPKVTSSMPAIAHMPNYCETC